MTHIFKEAENLDPNSPYFGSGYVLVAHLVKATASGPSTLQFIRADRELERLWNREWIKGRSESTRKASTGEVTVTPLPDARPAEVGVYELRNWLGERGYLLDLGRQMGPEAQAKRWAEKWSLDDGDFTYTFPNRTKAERDELRKVFPNAHFPFPKD